MKAIKFVQDATVGTLYSAGETAGFDDAVADDLIAQGVAEEVQAEEAAPEKPEKPEKAAGKA